MASRKGFLPVTPARLVRPELTQQQNLANIEQDNLTDDNALHESPTFQAIRDGLLRLMASSADSEHAPEREPDAPPASLPDSVTRFVPASSIPSSSPSSSRASSRARDELRADMRRVAPPSTLPATSQKLTANHWPKGDLLHKPSSGHSRNSSDASNLTQASLTIDKVPQLSPSRSESRFDTTSTRQHVRFAPTPAKEPKPERALYGPLEIDEDCFSVDSEFNRVPNVVPVETTKDNPMLLSNILKKTDAVFTGDPDILDLPLQIKGHGFRPATIPSSDVIRKRMARQAKLQERREARMWQKMGMQAAQAQLEAEALNEQKLAEHLNAQAALREQYAVAEKWREENMLTQALKAPPGLPNFNGFEHKVAHQPAVEEESAKAQPVVQDEPKSHHRYVSQTPYPSDEFIRSRYKSTLSMLLHDRGSSSGSTTSDGSQPSWATCSESSESSSAHDMPVRQSGNRQPSNMARNDSGFQTNGHIPAGDKNTYNFQGSCAIESCSTIGQDANGSRYF
ncbi:hypothetical protein SLS55_006652 [Diplodia seriata]|uniref:Uncharacterized protein n=1 Tax=Diplodia seriata TaxID=420778 RepID=A0ABR3CES5_9PEZI